MDLLSGYGSSGDDEEVHAPAHKRPLGEGDDTKEEQSSSAKKARGGVEDTRGGRLKASLDRLLRESPHLPTEERAEERRVKWEWFEKVCRAEFGEELRGGGGAGRLEVFGSWTYNMWVVGSDIDVNVRTPERIGRFFPRLKAAVAARDPQATVEVVQAQVPLARVCVQGLHIDVTHEPGDENYVAAHHVQVREWARRWQGDEVVCCCMRIVKLWATSRDVHSPRNHTLNSMGYMLMLLAVAAPPPPAAACAGEGGLDPVSDLLTRFFATYAASLKQGVPRTVVHAPHAEVHPPPSREADVYRLSQHARDPDGSGSGTAMFVQDPFLEDINVARFVNARSLRRLWAAFSDALGIMQAGGEDAYQQLVRRKKIR